MFQFGTFARPFTSIWISLLVVLVPIHRIHADIDRSGYLAPEEVKPGMKGFGRTVMSGSKIDTFDFEIIGVMRNSWYADHDVILVRCSGLNLEHSGIIAGMSGSPCYVKDKSGKARMLGAVAYGWSFNKDPICGIQPITQMLEITEKRAPNSGKKSEKAELGIKSAPSVSVSGKGVSIGRLLADCWTKPIRPISRFCIFNDDIAAFHKGKQKVEGESVRIKPLQVPLMVSGGATPTMNFLEEHLGKFGFMPVASGGATAAVIDNADNIKIEPGSALCVPLIMGDLESVAFGTCTEVIGDCVLGFGHALNSQGSVELPMATGYVHTIIPSVSRSFKLGAVVKNVGTLWGDENTGIFGILGPSPAMVPLEVVITDDIRGKKVYHYQVIQEENFTGLLLGTGLMESVYAHSELPREHTVRYAVETEFEDLGTFRISNMTSQEGAYSISMDVILPVLSLMNAPFGKVKVKQSRVEVTVEQGASVAMIDQVTLPKTVYKPGETVTAEVRWFHYRSKPNYTQASYSLTLPKDLPDGKYQLSVGSALSHLSELRKEKPHLFYAETPQQLLKAMNHIASYSENRLYMRLKLPEGGVAVKQIEMPELPSYQRHILMETKRTDVRKYTEALVVQHETDFMVNGEKAFEIEVNRRADQ